MLGPGTAVLYPNYPGEQPAHRGQTMGLNQETRFDLVFTIPFEDTLELSATISDNTPPSYAGDVDPNPDGTPGVHLHGACVAEMVTESTACSRLGPWAGLLSLEPESLLGGGGLPPSGIALTLNSLVPPPVVSSFQIEAAN